MVFWQRCFYGLALLWLSACASTELDRYLREPPSVPSEARVVGVPFLQQERNHCGPASLAMILGWAGKKVSPDELADKMFTPGKEGTFQMDVLGAVRREGFLGILIKGFDALFKELNAGNPVLVFENLGLSWYPRWHYAVAVGYDLERKIITLHSDRDANKEFSLFRFERDWEGSDFWAAVVLPPGRLSASADEVDHLEAASGLERVGKNDEAEVAYKKILSRWPKSIGAMVGLGNTHFFRGDNRGAVSVLKEATVFHPRTPEVWHNLAIAYSAANHPGLARQSARKALRLVTADRVDAYKRSLSSLLK